MITNIIIMTCTSIIMLLKHLDSEEYLLYEELKWIAKNEVNFSMQIINKESQKLADKAERQFFGY